jgi:hypothetical protein
MSAAPPAVTARGSHRLRNVLLIAAAFVIALGVAAGGTLFYFYDKSTAIDRSTPEVASRQFLDAALVRKDPTRLRLFICQSWSANEAIATTGIPGVGVVVTWGDTVATTTGDAATVTVRVVFRVPVAGGVDQDAQMWTLQLVDEDGWRVCGLTKQSSLNP